MFFIGVLLFLFVCGIVANQVYTHTLVTKGVKHIMDEPIKAKITTLEISSDTNYISRLTRNIMLGSNYDKDMKKVPKQKRCYRKEL